MTADDGDPGRPGGSPAPEERPPTLEGPSERPKYAYEDEPDMALGGSGARPAPKERKPIQSPEAAAQVLGFSDEPDFSVPINPLEPSGPAASGAEPDRAPEAAAEIGGAADAGGAEEPDLGLAGVPLTPLVPPRSEAPAEPQAGSHAGPELRSQPSPPPPRAAESVPPVAGTIPDAVHQGAPQPVLSANRTWTAPPPPPPPEGGNVLEVHGLRKLYGKKVAVATVGFSMTTGEVVGLLGPNGAGKTTVFYMIVGFIRPTAGRVSLDRHDITSKPMYKRARLGIAYLPQEPSVFRKLSVQDNIKAVLETRGDISAKRKKALLEDLLEEFGIAGIRAQKAYTLSGGERRRTEIARALALEPKFLLLDEPFAGIDPIAVHEIKSIVRRLSEAGIGVLITDHNVRDTLEITHRAHIINLGRIVVSGDRDEVLASDTARRIYLGEEFRM